ncbi:hypothetical protein FS837_001141 [Tulasnella sp. UAMH 9824]|nr:hypothetical protein FS837_001141 [Tulasnella sp. UAMH 9824]
MNGDVLEELVLSGALFSGKGGNDSPRRGGGSPSSSRSPSPDPFPVPAQYDSDGEGQGTSYVGNRQSSTTNAASAEPAQEPIGLGPGRTGVKGVIRDRDEARSRDLERIQKEMEDLAVRQQKMDFSVPSYFEELDQQKASSSSERQDQKREGDAWGGIEEWRRRRIEELKAGGRVGGASAAGGAGALYGHLREVGVGGFVEAVEKVPKEVWVVVHIYDGSLGRCAILDSHLSSLARLYPSVKFLRARAGAIGFATSNNPSGSLPSFSSHRRTTFRRNPGPSGGGGGKKRYQDPDESDSDDDGDAANAKNSASSRFVGSYPADDDDDRFDEEDEEEAEPDYDVLPTMLVYRGGELAHSWPRVDFDIASVAGKGGGVGYGGANAIEMRDVEALLVK